MTEAANGAPPPSDDHRYATHAKREAELLQSLAEERKRKITELARRMVVETIDEVQRSVAREAG